MISFYLRCSMINMSTHRHEEFLLLFLLQLGLLTYGLVFLLQLFQCSDLHLLEVMHLLLIVGSQPGEFLLITLVLLTQRLRKRKAVCLVSWFSTLDRDKWNFGSTCSSLCTCCLCCSFATWLWLSRASLSSSSLLIFSFNRLCSWSRFLMVASWVIWVACKEPIWPVDSQI